jgi:hypothetical protein
MPMGAAMFNPAPRTPRLPQRSGSRRHRLLAAAVGNRRAAIDLDAPVKVANAATVGLADQSTEDELVMIAGAHGVTVGPLSSATL